MSRERGASTWRRWREAALAACAVWLVVQNLVILGLVLWVKPASALAAGVAIARTAFALRGQLVVLGLAAVLALALAAWLVQAPVSARADASREVGDEW